MHIADTINMIGFGHTAHGSTRIAPYIYFGDDDLIRLEKYDDSGLREALRRSLIS
jgi:hypothetical protein